MRDDRQAGAARGRRCRRRAARRWRPRRRSAGRSPGPTCSARGTTSDSRWKWSNTRRRRSSSTSWPIRPDSARKPRLPHVLARTAATTNADDDQRPAPRGRRPSRSGGMPSVDAEHDQVRAGHARRRSAAGAATTASASSRAVRAQQRAEQPRGCARAAGPARVASVDVGRRRSAATSAPRRRPAQSPRRRRSSVGSRRRGHARGRPVVGRVVGLGCGREHGAVRRARWSSSSEWVPTAAMRAVVAAARPGRRAPPCDGRCTTSSAVVPRSTRASASSTSASVCTSSADSGSSSTSTRGRPMTARASASRWRWPPDSDRPCSPTRVSRPHGRSCTNSAWATASASRDLARRWRRAAERAGSPGRAPRTAIGSSNATPTTCAQRVAA